MLSLNHTLASHVNRFGEPCIRIGYINTKGTVVPLKKTYLSVQTQKLHKMLHGRYIRSYIRSYIRTMDLRFLRFGGKRTRAEMYCAF
jgi:hypothetical protein